VCFSAVRDTFGVAPPPFLHQFQFALDEGAKEDAGEAVRLTASAGFGDDGWFVIRITAHSSAGQTLIRITLAGNWVWAMRTRAPSHPYYGGHSYYGELHREWGNSYYEAFRFVLSHS
jgi:hypothetical protein